ncbi:hypothetical protein GCM10010145_65580 [Streptomyces ruber]|uniref:Uncharacterized protein n=2 Tax=Streptomyces TaxID=1883 RepID=A0A918BR53_9ACTN|nr:hypothetical protein GCM10010145_65580 [Streptomyces ruber]
MDKAVPTAADAVADVPDGASPAVGGLGLSGVPPKILRECALPLTGRGCADRIIAGLGVLDVTGDGLVPVECAPGVTPDEMLSRTAAEVRIPEEITS